jgi:hypothetical protein
MSKYKVTPIVNAISMNDIKKILDEQDIGAAMTDWMLKFARAIEKAHGIG